MDLKSAAAHRIDALGDQVRGDSETGAVLWPRGDPVPVQGLSANDSRGGKSRGTNAKRRTA
ncbi:hypothetical protein AA309_14320 [Microvirga vignae]|uniref:Uncharacterized protein n=1 Tax=Microvirga vignae TaxID=1225564 RepID=A0A0H1RCD2_9HYPH|nr:hypothetical protein AA309_14320 [Microvirga vignae]